MIYALVIKIGQNMNFKEYQLKSNETDQRPESDKLINYLIPFLGLVGEMGSVVSEFKKRIRDGKSYQKFRPKLEEELGDILWYISNIATKMGLDLEQIAEKNLLKTQNRWSKTDLGSYSLYDKNFPEDEKLPREFILEFKETNKNDSRIVEVFIDDKLVGDPLTDNSYVDDGYRYHDVFHYGFVAFLGWSPVVRKLLNIKRKSDSKVDEVEDGARAAFAEEAISAIIYSSASELSFYEGINTIDYEILNAIQKLVKPFEVKNRTMSDWENAILNSYRIFRYLLENKGGKIKVNIDERIMEIIT